MKSIFKLYYWKNLLAGIFIIAAGILLSQYLHYLLKKRTVEENQTVYLQQIRKDFIHHKEDVITIYNINKKIVTPIDSLLHTPGAKADTNTFRRIMNTRPYNLTVLAYKNILENNAICNTDLKLKIAAHVAQFQGLANFKLTSIHWQWDKTARPYLYNHAILTKNKVEKYPLTDPVFRSVLFDRRMFAHDVELITPPITASADSILNAIDLLLKK